MSEHEHSEQTAASEPERPGARLRGAREAKGLSREQVALELRLHPRIVTALEEGDEAQLPPRAFVAGYLRNYARLLDVPPDEIVTRYGRPEPRAPQTVGNVRSRRGAASSSPLMRLVSWLLVLALIGGGVAWWLSREPGGLPEISFGGEPEETTADEGGLQLPGAIQQPGTTYEAEPAAPRADTAPVGEAEPAPERTPEALSEPQPEPAAPVEAPEPAADAPTTETATAVEPPAEAGEAPEPATVPARAEAPTEPAQRPADTGGLPQLTLAFERDCWTEVTDAGGKRLIYDLVKAGRTRTVEGRAPFKVFLGYAPGVNVVYNGEPVDVSAYTEKQIARFTVGERADNPPRE